MIKKTIIGLLLRARTRAIKGSIGKNVFIRFTTKLRSFSTEASIDIADNASFGQHTELFVWKGHLRIGPNTSFNDNCKIYENVTIGANCVFASNIFISSGTHNFRHRPELPIKLQDKMITDDNPVVIDDDCWIGFGVVIMPGVHVGKGSVIGANSVVTKDVQPYSIIGGIPGKELNKRFDFEPPAVLDSSISSHWPYFYSGINYLQFENEQQVAEGVEVNAARAVFFLKKVPAQQLSIRGTASFNGTFRILLDGVMVSEKEVKPGEFDWSLNIPPNGLKEKPASPWPETFTSRFCICEIIATSSAVVSWKAKVVGLRSA